MRHCSALYPARVAIVEVKLRDGTKLVQRIDAVRGSAENPMTEEEVTAKARDLMTPFLGTEKSSRLIEAVVNLEKIADVRMLSPLLLGT